MSSLVDPSHRIKYLGVISPEVFSPLNDKWTVSDIFVRWDVHRKISCGIAEIREWGWRDDARRGTGCPAVTWDGRPETESFVEDGPYCVL